MSKADYVKTTTAVAVVLAGCGVAGPAFANQDVMDHMELGDVVQPNITYDGHNFSRFDQINLDNVSDLTVAWTFQLGVLDQYEASPLVVGDTMYMVSPVNESQGFGQAPNEVIALDLNDGGEILWEFRPDMDREAALTACCGKQTRGLQYAEGNIYFHTTDGHVYALDAGTGEAIWQSIGADASVREHTTGNGIIVGDLYIIGDEGGESGVRGHATAFDIHTGQIQWTMYSMGPDNEVGIGPRFNPHYNDDKRGSLSTWYGNSWRHGGGTVWGYFTYDPDTNALFYSTGNCSPWNPDYRRQWGEVDLDENNGIEGYKNNWCASMMSRDATTGELLWAYNVTPQDSWDFDEPQTSQLVDVDMDGDGTIDHTVMKAGRNGYFYVWDRSNGKLLNDPWPFVYVNFMTGVNLDTGRPSYNINTLEFTDATDRADYTQGQDIFTADQRADPDFAGTEVYVCPYIQARNWQNDSYSDQTGLYYVATTSSCGGLRAVQGEYVAGQGYVLEDFNPLGPIYGPFGVNGQPNPPYDGQLQAEDPVAGETRWAVDFAQGNNTPVLSTAGGLVFQGGSDDGAMHAYNAETGEDVWHFPTGAPFSQSAVAYMHDGKEYIAIIASGPATTQVNSGDASNNAARYQRAGATLYVFALPDAVVDQM